MNSNRKIVSLEARVKEAQVQVKSSSTERDTLQQELKDARQAIAKADAKGNEQNQKLESKIQTLEEAGEQAKSQIKELRTQLLDEKKEHEQTSNESKRQIRIFEDQLAEAQEQIKAANLERSALQRELISQSKAHEKASATSDRHSQKLNTRIEKLERASEQAAERTQAVKARLADAKAQHEQKSAAHAEEIKSLKTQFSEAQKQMRQLSRERDTLQQQLEKQRKINDQTVHDSANEVNMLTCKVAELEDHLTKSARLIEKEKTLAVSQSEQAIERERQMQEKMAETDATAAHTAEQLKTLELLHKEQNAQRHQRDEELASIRGRLNVSEKALKETRTELANVHALRNDEITRHGEREAELKAHIVSEQSRTEEAARDRENQKMTMLSRECQELSKEVNDLKAELQTADEKLARQKQDYDALRIASSRNDQDFVHLTQQPNSQEADDTWYLRADDDSEYGPVTLDELKDWASHCRIGPDHRLSRDRSEWLKARDVEALDMNWYVELVDGTRYGPLNLLAVRSLMEDGSVTADATLKHGRTNETWLASQILTPQVMEMRETIRLQEEKISDLAARLQEAKRDLAGKDTAGARQDAQSAGAIAGPPPKMVRSQVIQRGKK